MEQVRSDKVRTGLIIRLLRIIVTKVESLEINQIDNFLIFSFSFILVPIFIFFFLLTTLPFLFLVLIVHVYHHFG